MKALIISEKDVKTLMSDLEIAKFQLSESQSPTEDIYRHFNYIVVAWLHEQGSSYPN